MCSQQQFPTSPFSTSPSTGQNPVQDARLTSWLLAASAGAPNDYNRFFNAAMSIWQPQPAGLLSPAAHQGLPPLIGANPGPGQPGCYPAAPGGLFPLDPLRPFHPFCTELRMPFFREEPKPNHSYIGLIAMGILSSKDRKMVLSEIYQWIQDNYPYFRTKGPGWRNSIRHNLSLNDCFVKCGRSSNGKGHYWTIHEANIEDFLKGDFRRRRAQRKVRKHMGLSCGDDDDTPSPSPTDTRTFEWPSAPGPVPVPVPESSAPLDTTEEGLSEERAPSPVSPVIPNLSNVPRKRRGFDMASLLAPDDVQTTSHPLAPPMPFSLWHTGNFPHCFPVGGGKEPEDNSSTSPRQEDSVLEDC